VHNPESESFGGVRWENDEAGQKRLQFVEQGSAVYIFDFRFLIFNSRFSAETFCLRGSLTSVFVSAIRHNRTELGEAMNRFDQPLLRLEGVTKVFLADEVETHALSGIHLEIDRGEFVSIAGPSGCGKSTLLAILGLLDSPTEGTYMLSGRAVSDLAPPERAQIRNREVGFVFQSFNLIGDLTVFENVELPLTYRGVKASERRERVRDALERVGMAHRERHLPSQLSGGQQQRIAVARAVAGDPLIVLADEPTGNLDSAHGEAVMELLGELHDAGATICMVTHDPRYAAYADRMIHLFDGQVVEEQSKAA